MPLDAPVTITTRPSVVLGGIQDLPPRTVSSIDEIFDCSRSYRPKHQARVTAAEAERVRDGDPDRVRPGLVGDQAKVDVGLIQIDRGRDRLVPHRRQAGQGLERTRGREHVAGEALGRRDGNSTGIVAQDEAEDGRFGRVADRCARGVGVDMVDLPGSMRASARAWRMAAAAGAGSGLGITW